MLAVDVGEIILLLPLLLAVYFFPSIAAWIRGKRNLEAIFILNLLAGWTFVGWIVAIVWAATVDQPSPDPAEPPASVGLTRCPQCRQVPRTLTRCTFCRREVRAKEIY